ncbi:peptidoglycan recognition protein family protein [Brevibacillus brevis]|uniref:peptidoglycan recognition protein family protein n=1 Tax=Brevibacillus brevis TaxID=1393 RepID=UPI000D1063D2|nr:N-acetylmuramoyl-L-alanine amidase [Brevibacillus brevis]PSJ67439.1 hypothetical protein C7J99_20830 [Brevibacillus brevis]RED28423.1 N-acetylmuramoyl-L-alanine amidase [Brevibacillus brevis]GEC90677.1 hypothetical protein BBR01nite_30080 [Brevibacillus brevis]VEF91118.1 N-acetylmuramoyl-L-alanine amidase CwlH precursor [Brevibacillus brevis]
MGSNLSFEDIQPHLVRMAILENETGQRLATGILLVTGDGDKQNWSTYAEKIALENIVQQKIDYPFSMAPVALVAKYGYETKQVDRSDGLLHIQIKKSVTVKFTSPCPWEIRYLTNTKNFEHNPDGSFFRIKPTKGIIHWTANEAVGANADAHYKYFNSDHVAYPSNANIFVDDKKILQILPLWAKAWHVGAAKYNPGWNNANNFTFGIEICVNKDGDFKKAYQNAVYAMAKSLKECGLKAGDFDRHYDVTGKVCPAFFVDDAITKRFFNKTAAQAYAMFRTDVNNVYNLL